MTITPTIAPTADKAILVVKDANGRVVAREQIPLTSQNLEWTPKSAAGTALPTGLYDLSVENYYRDTKLSTTTVEHYAKILEAQGGPSGTKLVLAGGVEISANDITALRVPRAN